MELFLITAESVVGTGRSGAQHRDPSADLVDAGHLGDLYHSADWMFGTRQDTVTGVGAGSIGLSAMNNPAYGRRRQAMWALISRGAR